MSSCISAKRTALSAAVAAAIVSSGAASAQGVLEEITVTATKRAEPMSDIPVSIQAMTGDMLDEVGADSFEEYVEYLPNVVYSGRGPGQSEIYIRGAATEQSSITITSVQGSAPAVALYQDEQPVSFGGRNLDVYATDLQRIEVLAGPQGTLFGASSQTGTIRLISNKPDHGGFDAGFQSRFEFTDGGEPSTAVEAMVNIPFGDNFAFRMAAFSDNAGGWIDNVPGTYSGNIEVINRNQISGAAHICTGDPVVDDPIAGAGICTARATMATADNSTVVEDDFNDASYNGARFGLSWLINDDWDILVQHTQQKLDSEGAFEYDPNLSGEQSVNRFTKGSNQDEFGLTTWTLNGRLGALDLTYTGGFLDRDVFYVQDYTGYTNGGGYQAYYICTGGYSSADQCFSPLKQYLGEDSNQRFTNEIRINTPAENRWRLTAGIYIDDQETTSDGEFQYQGAVEAGFNTASAPGTITSDGLPPTGGNIVSTVDGVTDPFGRGSATIFVNSFTRNEEQIAFFGEFAFDFTDNLTASVGFRNYDIDYEFIGSTGSSFGCKGSPTPCDGQSFDNRVSERLEAIGAFNESGDVSDLETFFSPANAQLIADGVAAGTFFVKGLGSDGVANQDDTIVRATVNYHLNDDVMIFGAYSEGFRPQTANRNAGNPSANQSGVYQGFLVPGIVKTDELENVEIGLKGDFLDGSLRINATAYSSEITDLQMSRFDPANVAFLVFIENVGDAEITGLDADFAWAATDNLTINGAIGLVDNELKNLNPALQDIAVPEGSRLPWTPELSANVRFRYDFRLDGFDADAYFRAGFSYTGDSRALSTCNAYFIEDTTQQVLGNRTGLKIVDEGSGFCGNALTGGDLAAADPAFLGVDGSGNTRYRAARYEQEAYTTVNVGFGVQKDEWGAELFINNLTNENAQLNIQAADWVPRVTTNRPLTAGVKITYDYD